MKSLIFGAVLISVCLFVALAKEHPNKEKIVTFYNCAVCTDDPVINEAYEKCSTLKSDLMIELKTHCLKELLGADVNLANHGKELCETDGIGGIGKIFDCIYNLKEERGIEPTEEQQKQLEEFLACAMELNEKHCK